MRSFVIRIGQVIFFSAFVCFIAKKGFGQVIFFAFFIVKKGFMNHVSLNVSPTDGGGALGSFVAAPSSFGDVSRTISLARVSCKQTARM
jgi:hypothetical protein